MIRGLTVNGHLIVSYYQSYGSHTVCRTMLDRCQHEIQLCAMKVDVFRQHHEGGDKRDKCGGEQPVYTSSQSKVLGFELQFQCEDLVQGNVMILCVTALQLLDSLLIQFRIEIYIKMKMYIIVFNQLFFLIAKL